ncbi:MAG: hypothetical protein WAQ98_32440 [Blastocatellia bacterium]
MGFHFGDRYIENAELEFKNCNRCKKRFLNLAEPRQIFCNDCVWQLNMERANQLDLTSLLGVNWVSENPRIVLYGLLIFTLTVWIFSDALITAEKAKHYIEGKMNNSLEYNYNLK